jgi:hypothetical protein
MRHCHGSVILTIYCHGWACCAFRTATPLIAEETLRMICFSYVRSLITNGIIWGGGDSPHNNNVFKIQKRIIWIISKTLYRDSSRQLFKKLEMLHLYSQYIFSLLLLVVKNRDSYTPNQEIRGINTRYNTNLHIPMTNLIALQRGFNFFLCGGGGG